MKPLDVLNPFGAPVYHEETVSSTMDAARALKKSGAPHGTVITADFQESGRGRMNRLWKMDRGSNLIFTIILNFSGDSNTLREQHTPSVCPPRTAGSRVVDSLRRVHTPAPWGGTKVWTLSQIPYENNHTPLLAAGLVDLKAAE
jgi:hypothetical protein